MTTIHKGPIGAFFRLKREEDQSDKRSLHVSLLVRFFSIYQPSRNKENGSSMLPIRNSAKERGQAAYGVCLT